MNNDFDKIMQKIISQRSFFENWENIDDDQKEELCNENEDLIVCPYCGYYYKTDYDDPNEWGLNKVVCDNCKKEYELEKYQKTFYSTRKSGD